jgi:hypothetical protein
MRRLVTLRLFAALLAAMALVVPAVVDAQSLESVATSPPNIVLPNYDNVPVGPYGGLEGSAYVARVSDPSAAWFNPAGLSRQSAAEISGSGGVYRWTAVSPDQLPNKGGSVEQLPNVVGFTFRVRDGVTAGAAVITTNSWGQAINAQLLTSRPGVEERFAYSADSEFQRRLAAIGVGYDLGGPWRVGGGFAFSNTHLFLVQDVSNRVADAESLRTLLVTSRAEGSALQIRGQAGVQYDRDRVRFGVAVRSPGWTLHESGALTLEGIADLGTASVGASLFDAGPQFKYRLPWEVQGGVNYVTERVELEADLHGYTAIDPYQLLSTGASTVFYGDAGGENLPVVVTRPFDRLMSASNGVVNLAIGGHVKPMRDRSFRVHAGFATDRSPVADADQVFSRVDMTSWTVGVSGSMAKLQFSVGLNWRVGAIDNLDLINLLNRDELRSRVDVRTGGLIYALAYQF